MIGFFRRIRFKLANENQFVKYSRYAIGEILLVMVGILLALQVNNWNESRKLKLSEQVVLNSLKTDFTTIASDINRTLNRQKGQRTRIVFILNTSTRTENT